MKRRIAVFSNAWSEKSLSDSLEGIKECAQENDIDVFVFISHAALGNELAEQREEKRIYQLPELDEFDGVIMFSTAMNFPDLVQDIWQRAQKAGVPLVSVGERLEGASYVGFNNKSSMSQLVEHLIVEHGVKEVEFIAGAQDSIDSNIRIEATREVLEKHGLALKEEQVHYGDWSVRGAMTTAGEIVEKKGGNTPDAFVCANDSLAMAVCAEMEKRGIRVPEDVIVTGYDELYDGQIFYPAICTVGKNDFLAGKKACESLISAIKGEMVEEKIIESGFVRNQSCGCKNDNAVHLRTEECKKQFYKKITDLEFGWSNSWLAERVLNSTGVDDIRKNLNSHFEKSRMFENGTAYVLEDTRAKTYFAGKNGTEIGDGYTDQLEVMAAVENYKLIEGNVINRREMIPGYHKIDGVSKLYIFLPIHFHNWVFGYAVLENWTIGLSDGRIKVFADSFNQTIEKLKQNFALEHLNSKLRDLYTRDGLTGMYNRFGFASEGNRIFEECKEQKKNMVLMFADINRMKLINDYYGHLQGDMAIKTTAEAITKNIQKDWIAIRFGGDEFLIMGQCDRKEEIDSIKEQIVADVKKAGQQNSFPFYLSASCGYLHFCPEEERTLDSYIKQADEAMYEIKAYMHASDPELKAFVDRCRETQL